MESSKAIGLATFIISLFAAIFLSASQTLYAADITRLFLTAPTTINAGDEFEVQVNISGVVDLAGFEIDINFDYTKFKVLNLSRGDFLGDSDDPASTYWVEPDLSAANSRGIIENIACTRIGAGGKSGTGTLCTLRLRDIGGEASYSSRLAFTPGGGLLSDSTPSLMQAVKTGLTIYCCDDLINKGLPTLWIPLGNILEERSLQMPVQNLTNRAFRFKAITSGLRLRQIRAQGRNFQQFLLPGGRLFGDVGRPGLPGFTRLVAVPKDANMVITINEGESQSLSDCLIYPMQEQPIDSQSIDTEDYPQPPFTMDNGFYQSDTTYPGSLVSIREDWVRGCKVALIHVHTCRYNPGQRKLLYYPDLEIDIQFEGGDGTYMPMEHRSRFFEESYAKIFSNYESVKIDERQILQNRPGLGTLFDPCDLLIITPGSLETVANQLAEWKTEKGFLTKVTTLTEIYEAQTGQTAGHIREYIKNIYKNRNLSYVILLGDSEYIPCHYVTPDSHDEGSFIGTDLYYAEMDDSGYFPDLGIGRIPVVNVNEAQTVVDKIIQYEQNPPNHSRFYQRINCCAFFEDDNQDGREDTQYIETMEEICNFFLSEEYPSPTRIYTTNSPDPQRYQDGDSITDGLGMPGFAWSGGADDLINEINSGTFLVIHRDHAGPNGWSNPGFHTEDLVNLSNGDLLPVVLSINCSSGYFDYYTSMDPYWDSFAEEFLTKQGGGAVAVIAASRTSPTYPNDDLTKGFIDGLWPAMLPEFPAAGAAEDSIDGNEEAARLRFSSRLGDVLNYAKFYLTTMWSEATCLEEFEMYHCLGDPTMEMWTKSPYQIPIQIGPFLLGKLIYTIPMVDDDVLVSIIQNGRIIGQGYSFSGQVTIPLADPLGYSTNTKISMTKEGHITSVHPANFINQIFFADNDGDGFGNPGLSIQSPYCPPGYVDDSSDCDDGNFNLNPGNLGIINRYNQLPISDFLPGAYWVTVGPRCSQYNSYTFLEYFWNRGKRLGIHQSSMANGSGKMRSTYWFFGKPGGENYTIREGVNYKVFGFQ